jgi:hypothetical protein
MAVKQTKAVSLLNLGKSGFALLTSVTTAVLITSKFWLDPTNHGADRLLIRYISTSYLPELVTILMISILLAIPFWRYRMAGQTLSVYFSAEYRDVVTRLVQHRLSGALLTVLWLFIGFCLWTFFSKVNAPLGDIVHQRVALIIRWSGDDFERYAINRINEDLRAGDITEGKGEFLAAKEILGSRESFMESSKLVEEFDNVQRFGMLLTNRANELETQFGKNRRSFSLYAHALFLLPEDKSLKTHLRNYHASAEAATKLEHAIKQGCTAHGTFALPPGTPKELAYMIDDDTLRREFIHLISSSTGDVAEKSISDICHYDTLFGSIFNAALSRVDMLEKLGIDPQSANNELL